MSFVATEVADYWINMDLRRRLRLARRISFVLAIAPALVPARASAADPWGRIVALDVQAGLGSPYGLLGASIDVTPTRYLTFAVGAGIVDGSRLVVMPRLRLPAGRTGTAIAVGAGASYGSYSIDNGSCYGFICGVDPTWTATFAAVRLNGDISVEHRARSGFEIRGYVGVGEIVAASKTGCSSNFHDSCPSGHDQLGRVGPYVGMAIGYALDL
jgi:hypothetical protein